MWLVNRERLRPLSEWLLTHLPSRCRADKEGSGRWGSTRRAQGLPSREAGFRDLAAARSACK